MSEICSGLSGGISIRISDGTPRGISGGTSEGIASETQLKISLVTPSGFRGRIPIFFGEAIGILGRNPIKKNLMKLLH